MRQLSLLSCRRFGPFFVTQALGAMNDNVFRFALMFLLTFGVAQAKGWDIHLLMNLAAGLFILPFFLFSSLGGQLADRFDKAIFIRWIKGLELLIMLAALLGFWMQWWSFLVALVFVMGLQSALFGPVKYALLPQQLSRDELVFGNALVGMGTFVAILLGTLAGGLMAGWAEAAVYRIGLVCVGLSLLGLLASLLIPRGAVADPDLRLNLNLFSQIAESMRLARRHRGIWVAMLAVSWFWFMGSGYLTQFPTFARHVVYANETVATLLLALFTLGVGAGALLAGYWSRGRIELGLVPLGALGMAIFSSASFYQGHHFPPLAEGDSLRSGAEFVAAGGVGLCLTLMLAGMSGGGFIVPLYSYVQRKAPGRSRARVIAAMNILNALAMVVSALTGLLLLSLLTLSLPLFYLVYGLTALVVFVASLFWVRDALLRFVVYLISHTLYRVRHQGLEQVPERGAALVVANHVSYMDALLLAGACHRPLRFVIDRDIHDLPLLNQVLQWCGTVPLSSEKVDRNDLNQAFAKVGEALARGELVFVFPEGRLTRDGEIQPFKRGIERLVARYPVPVIPMALSGLWGSWFSRQGGRAFLKWPRRFWSPVDIRVGAPIAPDAVSAADLQARVAALRGPVP